MSELEKPDSEIQNFAAIRNGVIEKMILHGTLEKMERGFLKCRKENLSVALILQNNLSIKWKQNNISYLCIICFYIYPHILYILYIYCV